MDAPGTVYPCVSRYRDELDARSATRVWLSALVGSDDCPAWEFDDFRFLFDDPTAQPQGRVSAVWFNGHLAGTAMILRDQFNWSVLVTTVFPLVRHGR